MSRYRDALERVPEEIDERAMPFGKHRGTLMKDLPEDYVRWLADPAREQPVPGKNYAPFHPSLIAWARAKVASFDQRAHEEDFAKRCLGGHPTGYRTPLYIIECEGDCHSESGAYAIDRRWFTSLDETLEYLSSEFPIKLSENLDGERNASRATPDPEDDRILVWEVLPSGHRRAVWGFFGWHFNQDEFACGQGALPGDEKSLYTIACHDL